MKKNNQKKVGLKSLATALLTGLLVIALGGCSKGVKDDMEALFNTVPSDAAAVLSGDLEKIIDQAGGKVKDGKVVSLGNVEKMGLPGNKQEASEAMEKLENVAESVKAGAFVGFLHKGEFYMTCMLTDPAVFKAAVAKEQNGEWRKEGKCEVLKNYVVVDDRLWIADGSSSELISGFMNLSEAQSFLSCEYSGKMAESSDAVNVWVSLDAAYSTLPFAQQAQARMAVSMVFENPAYLTGTVNFTKTGVEMEMLPRTSDYKASKCVIDVAKIDTKKVASLEGNANIVAALAVSPKLIKQIKDLGGSMGGALPTQMLDVLNPLDGTLAFATQSDGKGLGSADDGFRAVVSTNGQQNAALGQVLETLGTVKISGNDFNLSKGSYGKGGLNVAEVAKKMEGAWIGFAVSTKDAGEPYDVLVLLTPSEGSLALKVSASRS